MKIAVYGRVLYDKDVPLAQKFYDLLEKHGLAYQVEVSYLDSISKRISFKNEPETFSKNEVLAGKADVLITFGGDGTLLDSLSLLGDFGIPVMGINAGRLGFLTSAGRTNFEEGLMKLKNKEYKIDHRTLLKLESDKPVHSANPYALNEFTISKLDTASMIHIEAYLNEEYLTSYYADGIILSTSTGSTGYSLSVGGPIITPESGVFVLSPVAAHNLNIRPLVISENSKVRFKVTGRTNDFLTTLDSRKEHFDSSFSLSLSKAEHNLKLIRFAEDTFIDRLKEKLHWGTDIRG